MDRLATSFVAFSRQKLAEEFWPRLAGCLGQLSEEQIWWRPNEACNSIGNLLLHLNGNVRQWILGGLGGIPDNRTRDAEFAERRHVDRATLLGALGETLAEVEHILGRLTEEDLLRKHTIQGYEVTGLEVVYHVVEHFGVHYGQIVYIVKMLQGRDLGFYAHLSGSSKGQQEE